jgi:hypothetical protein
MVLFCKTYPPISITDFSFFCDTELQITIVMFVPLKRCDLESRITDYHKNNATFLSVTNLIFGLVK